MNVFVGLNDVGKSNVLRALNLFFNGETINGMPFNFDAEFTTLFPKKSNHAKEISISIKFDVPTSYKQSGHIVWTKIWRAGGVQKDEIVTEDGSGLSSRSRLGGALSRIKYRYVPAVKSRDYYKYLLVELYNTISISLNEPMSQSTQAFADSIKKNTQKLAQSLFGALHMKSVLSIPDNMQEIFRSLVFTTSEIENENIPLEYRGDGIQARHIPLILKFIADEDSKTRNKGSMRVFTIWGFEEPENGIGLLKCYELAEEFHTLSEQIQMFITTHSPAFYTRKPFDLYTSVFFVSKSEKGQTEIKADKAESDIDDSMGVMPLVAPYIDEYRSLYLELKKVAGSALICNIDTIFVEGKTDKLYLEKAIEIHKPELADRIKTKAF